MASDYDDLRIFTAGGTIDKSYRFEENGLDVGEPFVAETLKIANVRFRYQVTSLLRKDSLEFTDEDRLFIRKSVEAAPEKRILITHGTDTMVETALGLIGIPGKTIVLTGAMVPGRVIESDAVFNIGFAVSSVFLQPEGCHIAMHGILFDPRQTRKNREIGRFVTIDESR
jgi:L-asparaginase